jgi:hypothetical protein
MTLFRKVALGGVVAVLVLGWLTVSRLSSRAPAAAPVKPSVIAWRQEAPSTTVTDAEEIFKRAFWRRPSEEDQILQAERHEWSDKDGLQRWQWFLMVKASPKLIKDLKDDNVFGLMPGSSDPLNREAPVWFVFKPDDFSTFQSPQTGLRLMFSKVDNTLYATDSGRGFTKGAPEPDKPTKQVSGPGRLPARMPPFEQP